MSEHLVSVKDYYRNILGAASVDEHLLRNVELCAPAMRGLIARYGLEGKLIFSLGAGEGFEEFILYRAGCPLTLLDIAEATRNFVAASPQLAPGTLHDAQAIRRIFEDAATWVDQNPVPEFDVLYCSSMHTDEMRRLEIQEQFKLERSRRDAGRFVSWPKGALPYHEIIVGACRKVVPGGLILQQHYRGGPSVDYNRFYLDDVIAQFEAHGEQLVEGYCFRQSTAHLFLTALKGSREEALAFAQGLAHASPITTFHGRYGDDAAKRDVRKFYSITAGNLLPAIEGKTDILAPLRDAFDAARSIMQTARGRP